MIRATLLGLLAFVILGGFDLLWLKGVRWRWVLWLLGIGVFGVALADLLVHAPLLPLGGWSAWVGWPLTLIAGLLLVYSLGVEIPLQSTYMGLPAGEDRLITEGTYALCRHPGVLWAGLWFLGLLLVTKSSWLLVAGPVWWIADAFYVIWQERYVLRPKFPAYDAYCKTTPMLWPTKESLRRCWSTLPIPKSRREE